MQAGEFAGYNVLMGNKGSGSAFKKEQKTGNQFQISYVDEDPGADPKHPMYLATNNDHPSGLRSIILGQGPSMTCEMDGDYIKIVSPKPGYFGYDEESESAVFVEDKKGEKAGELWLKFTWREVEHDKAGNVMRAPDFKESKPPVKRVANIDKK